MPKPDEAPTIIFSMLGVSKKIERKEILRDEERLLASAALPGH